MKKVRNVFFAVAVAGLMMLSSCSLTRPVAATSNPVGSKVGVASTTQIIGFFPDGGDASIQTAAKNGGITKISTVDYRFSLVFLTFIMKHETIVTGE